MQLNMPSVTLLDAIEIALVLFRCLAILSSVQGYIKANEQLVADMLPGG